MTLDCLSNETIDLSHSDIRGDDIGDCLQLFGFQTATKLLLQGNSNLCMRTLMRKLNINQNSNLISTLNLSYTPIEWDNICILFTELNSTSIKVLDLSHAEHGDEVLDMIISIAPKINEIQIYLEGNFISTNVTFKCTHSSFIYLSSVTTTVVRFTVRSRLSPHL